MSFEVAIVGRDPALRMAAARAFETAPAEWTVRLFDEVPEGAGAVVDAGDGGLEGAVVFDPARPGDAVRAVAALVSRPPAPRTVVVVGATGGAGVTSIALHLAAEWGPGACCAELRAGIGPRLGLPRDPLTWRGAATDVSSCALPVAGGFRVLLAPDAGSFPAPAARAAFDRLVVDAGVSRDLGPLAADVVVLVTPPTRPGALATRALLDALTGPRCAVVVNRAGPGGQIMRAGLEALVGRSISLELPCSPALRDAEDEARLLSGRGHRWRRGVARLARALDAC